MKKIKSRLIVFLTGCIIFLLILEISLRVVGSFYAGLSEADTIDTAQTGKDRITILSIGDSVTFGIGADRGFSYPAQLEKLLNESESTTKYSVINRGWPAQNSAQLLMRLESWLKEFRPDIVTILIGAQNQANYFGYQEFLQKSGHKKRGLFLQLHDWMDRVRIYKFIRLIVRDSQAKEKTDKTITASPYRTVEEVGAYPGEFESVKDLFSQTPEQVEWIQQRRFAQMKDRQPPTPECVQAIHYHEQGAINKALETILSVVENRDVESECYNIIGSIYMEQQQFDKAIGWFKKGIEKDPGLFVNYEGIGKSYRDQDRLKQAIDWFKKGFEHARYETLYELCYVGISETFRLVGDYKGAITFFEKEVKREPLLDDYIHALAGDYLSMFKKQGRDRNVHEWVIADIEKIIALSNRYKAQVILQNYPFQPSLDPVFRQIARRFEIPFVDHQSTFEPYINRRGKRSAQMFVPDGHPNAKGYHMMARNILKKLKP